MDWWAVNAMESGTISRTLCGYGVDACPARAREEDFPGELVGELPAVQLNFAFSLESTSQATALQPVGGYRQAGRLHTSRVRM